MQCYFCKRQVAKTTIIRAVKEGFTPEFIDVMHGQVPDDELYEIDASISACKDCYRGVLAATRIGRILQNVSFDEDNIKTTRELILGALREKVEDSDKYVKSERTVLAALWWWLFFESSARSE